MGLCNIVVFMPVIGILNLNVFQVVTFIGFDTHLWGCVWGFFRECVVGHVCVCVYV